jgi:PAS domain S-box-containing protein
MTSAEQSASSHPNRPWLLDWPREVLWQARLAFGVRGVAWALAAAFFGLAFGAIAFALIPLRTQETARGDAGHIDEFRAVESAFLDFSGTLGAMSTGALEWAPGEHPALKAWGHFTSVLDGYCGKLELGSPYADDLRPICDGRADLVRRLTPQVERFDPPRVRLEKLAMSDLLGLRAGLHQLVIKMGEDSDKRARRFAERSRIETTLLACSVAGFAAAGLVLLLLAGRASIRQAEQMRKAKDAAELLSETIEALPAGLVVYDADERLTMLNVQAAAIAPALGEPGAIGKTYEELAREQARRLEAAGGGPQPIDDWIARFRYQKTERTQLAIDGRWFEWSERKTPSGKTVGLRIDITEIKNQELELGRARAEYQSLVDSMSDVVFKLDLKRGVFTFVSAAAAEFFGRPVTELVGSRFLDHVAPEDRDRVLDIARTANRSAVGMIHEVRFRMLADGGVPRHVELRTRRTNDEQGRVGITGVMHDIEDRVQLERRLELQMVEQEMARARYQLLVDSLSDMVYAIDAKGTFVYASPGAAGLLGVPSSTVIGTRFRDWVADEDVDQVMEAGKRFNRSPNPEMRQMQFRMKTADGTIRPVELRYRKPVGEGQAAAQVGVIRDISERVELLRRLEEQLTQLTRARGEYQALVDSLGDVVYTIDVKTGLFTFASAATTDVFGIAPQEFVGTHFLEHIAPESREEVTRTTTRDYDPADQGTFAQFSMKTGAGESRHVEVRARRRVDEEGRVISTGVIRDVEDRVRLERSLEQERARLRSIVESSGALIVLVDSELRVVMVNSGFVLLSGRSEADTIGRPLREILEMPLERVGEGATPFSVKLRTPDGRERLISFTATTVADPGGRSGNMVLLGVDDTERREAEQALYDTERFATVGEMAGTMAHEISQPLQVINIACASAREELSEDAAAATLPDVEYLRGKLDRISQQVDMASRIVGDLRAFVRGTNAEAAGLTDPAKAVRSAVDLTAHGVHQAGATISLALDEGLPSVAGESGRLEQVLVNLINNARDAGGRTISILAQAVRQDGLPFVRIAVEDSGPGIAPDVLPRLFVSFVTTKPRGKGTGLGLRICRRIVEEMGGGISAANLPQGGACFEILLPALAA